MTIRSTENLKAAVIDLSRRVERLEQALAESANRDEETEKPKVTARSR